MLNRRFFLSVLLPCVVCCGFAAVDYKHDKHYLMLRDSMHHAFNDGDSARFFHHVRKLKSYLLEQNDLHAYYTQRCNEIVFQMNRQNIFEAYKGAQQLSRELVERKLDREMYMAINMMGHIYRFCGNKESAKKCFREVIERMEKAGYPESIPPIYMNIVNVEMTENPEEAMLMLNKALEIARESSPERVFDIETRRTLAFYNQGDTLNFLKGYEVYRNGVDSGFSSVHGRELEVCYLAYQGKVDEAVQLADKELSGDGLETQERLLKNAGRWKEAYEVLKREAEANDSLNYVLLGNSMRGIQDEMRVYEAERRASKNAFFALAATTVLLLLLLMALVYIVFARRRHIRQLKNAYHHALESDRMKSAFIQNVSHEVRTPLNIISGFAQVFADPSAKYSLEERKNMADMMQKNTDAITTLIDEMLELSLSDSSNAVAKDDRVCINELLREVRDEEGKDLNSETRLVVSSSLAEDFTMQTNRMMMKRILTSLVNNAVKYTEQGVVKVMASTTGNTLTLVVEDTGCGIPVVEAEHIFERFVKLDTFKVGIGLGLTLCRVTSQRLGGSVCLDTTYSSGARFVVELPIND